MSSRPPTGLSATFTVLVTMLVVLSAFAPTVVGADGTDSASDSPTISGRLVSPDGEPLSDDLVAVGFWGEDGGLSSTNVTTGDDGRFSVESNATASHQLAYFQKAEDGSFGPRDGVADVFTIGDVGPKEDVDFGDIEIPEGHVLDIRVVDENGEPIEDASVRVYHDVPNVQEGWAFSETTNADGMFDSPEGPSGVEVAGDVLVYVEGPDGLTTYEQSLTVTEDRALTVTLNTPTTISGRLVTEDGEPIANSIVHHGYWNESARHYSWERTDEDGRFTIAGVANARNQLTFFEDEDNAIDTESHDTVDMYTFDNRALTERSENVDLGEIVVPEGHVLEVQVVDENGNPVENAIVDRYHNVDCIDCSPWIQHLTDSDGQVRSELTGEVKIGVFARESITGFDSETVWKNVTITEDRTVTVTLESPGDDTDGGRTGDSSEGEQSGDDQSDTTTGDGQASEPSDGSDAGETPTDDVSTDEPSDTEEPVDEPSDNSGGEANDKPDDTENAPSGGNSSPPQTNDAGNDPSNAGQDSVTDQSEDANETTTAPPLTTTTAAEQNATTETQTATTETSTPQTETTTSEPTSLAQTTATPDEALAQSTAAATDSEKNPTTETTFPGFGAVPALLAALILGLLLARRR